MIVVAKLEKPYTDAERISFIVNYNHQLGYQINETENELQALGYDDDERKEQKEAEVRAVRNQYLYDTDRYMIVDYPITEAEETQYIQYREYLRNYPETENWYESNPLTFEEWKEDLNATEQIKTMGDVYGTNTSV